MERYIKVSLGGISFTQPISEPMDVITLFDGADPGEKYIVEVVEMSAEDYEKLPEFDGF